MADITFIDHGSIILMRPNTPDAAAWVAEHVPNDAPAWGNAIAMEPRCVEHWALAALAEGLIVDVEGD
jgi:hypothetical protein